MATTLWGTASSLVQVIFWPTLTLTGFGSNAKSLICTAVPPPEAEGAPEEPEPLEPEPLDDDELFDEPQPAISRAAAMAVRLSRRMARRLARRRRGPAKGRAQADDHRRVVGERRRERGTAAGPVGSRPRARTWSTPWPPATTRPAARGAAHVEVAAQDERRRARPAAERHGGRAHVGLRALLGVHLGVEVGDPAPVGEPHGVDHAPLGPAAQAGRRCSAMPDAADEDRVGPSAVGLQRVRPRRGRPGAHGQARLRDVSAVRALAPHARASSGGHHGGTSWSSATSQSQPASAAANSL